MDNAFYALLGVLIGNIVTLSVQLRLRKERFKEFVYKERLAAYKEVAECLWKIVVIYVAVFDDKKKSKEMRDEFIRLNNAIDKNILFVSEIIRKHVVKFRNEVMMDVFKIFENQLSLEDFLLSHPEKSLVEGRYTALIKAMREELGVEKLSEDLMKTFKFWK